MTAETDGPERWAAFSATELLLLEAMCGVSSTFVRSPVGGRLAWELRDALAGRGCGLSSDQLRREEG